MALLCVPVVCLSNTNLRINNFAGGSERKWQKSNRAAFRDNKVPTFQVHTNYIFQIPEERFFLPMSSTAGVRVVNKSSRAWGIMCTRIWQSATTTVGSFCLQRTTSSRWLLTSLGLRSVYSFSLSIVLWSRDLNFSCQRWDLCTQYS